MKYENRLKFENVDTHSVILNMIDDKSKVLEFGPASGYMTRYLVEQKQCQVYCVEIDPEMACIASKYSTEMKVTDINDIESWYNDYSEHEFDYIIFADVLEHIDIPVEILEYAQRLLTKVGYIVISVPNYGNNSIILDLLNDRISARNNGILDNTHKHFLTYSKIINYIELSGLTIEKAYSINVPPYKTEFENDYTDVPQSVKEYLKKRKFSEAYQFVFKTQFTGSYCEFQLTELEVGDFIEVFVKGNNENFSVTNSLRDKIDQDRSKYEFEFESNNEVDFIRIDPTTFRCEFSIESLKINGVEYPVNELIYRTDGLTRDNSHFVSYSADPKLILNSPVKNCNRIEIEICYGSRLDDFRDVIGLLESQYTLSNVKLESLSKLRSELKRAKTFIGKLEAVIRGKDHWLAKIEHDVNALNEVTSRTQSDNLSLKGEITRLSQLKDQIDLDNSWILKLEESIKTKDDWISKLEENIKTKDDWISKLEESIKAKDDWIVNLGNDISQFKYEIDKRDGIIESLGREIKNNEDKFNALNDEIIAIGARQQEIKMSRKFDLTIVTFNSEKWILPFLSSFEKIEYPTECLNLIFIDNGSTDNTVKLIESYSEKERFSNYILCDSRENVGYGEGNNRAAKCGFSDFIFIINVDTEVTPDMFEMLNEAIDKSDATIAAWELRQIPYEHPKFYDPVTLETSWFSGAAVVIRRRVFEEVNGFDSNIFMYAEDVDLSWRIRAVGYKIQYTPKAEIIHHSYTEKNEVKHTQFVNSLSNNLMLRYKFGKLKDIAEGYYLLSRLLLSEPVVADQKRYVSKMLLESFNKGLKFRKSFNRDQMQITPKFLGFDYEIVREGAFYENSPKCLESMKPLVSVIVRTHKRPTVLRETLISLRNQTYSNFEVVIVEDGKPTSKEMVEAEFYDVNISYYSTVNNIGRSAAGNYAMSVAKGEYFNFLDDDDLMFADHIEVMVNEIMKSPDVKGVYGSSYETPIIVESKEPYIYDVLNYEIKHNREFNRMTMINHNMFPIQAVLFNRHLFDQYGGFDESIDYLEDWDMWLRYTQRNDFRFVDKLTSIYRVPGCPNVNKSRMDKLSLNYEEIKTKYLSAFREARSIDIDVTKIKSSPKVKYYIDTMKLVENDLLCIRGWAFIENQLNNNNEIYFALVSGKSFDVRAVSRHSRPDVSEHFGSGYSYENSGFDLYLDISSIERNCIEQAKLLIGTEHEVLQSNANILIQY